VDKIKHLFTKVQIMKTKTLSLMDNVSVRKVISLLKRGDLLVGPSDTVLGLYAAPTKQGFLSLNLLKKRSNKPYLLLISGQGELLEYVDRQDMIQVEKIMAQCWPGPLTIIFKARKGTPAYLCSDKGTIACRIPKQAQIQQLLAEVGSLFSTSANISGEPIAKNLDEMNPIILEKVAAILEGESDPNAVPSTLLDASSGTPTIIREGAYSKKDIFQ
jgi:L-threonylcarbamoyladenylate synthase